MGDETRLKYVVVGRIATPTDAQHARAAKNGGWKERIICGVPVLWNSCVSPPFGGDKYDLATAQPNFMTPKVGGVERYSLDPHHGATAYSGSGFDDGSRQHRFGSDAVRYAIAIQQHRDAGDYAMADQAKAFAQGWYQVKQTKDTTTLKYLPLEYWNALRFSKELAQRKLDEYKMPIIEGVIYDGSYEVRK